VTLSVAGVATAVIYERSYRWRYDCYWYKGPTVYLCRISPGELALIRDLRNPFDEQGSRIDRWRLRRNHDGQYSRAADSCPVRFIGFGFQYESELTRTPYYIFPHGGELDSPVKRTVVVIAMPLWFLVFVTAGWPIGVVVCRLSGLRGRARPGHCHSCGYDLRASRERCPECGEPIAATRRGDVTSARASNSESRDQSVKPGG
jgi:hypothetical protein